MQTLKNRSVFSDIIIAISGNTGSLIALIIPIFSRNPFIHGMPAFVERERYREFPDGIPVLFDFFQHRYTIIDCIPFLHFITEELFKFSPQNINLLKKLYFLILAIILAVIAAPTLRATAQQSDNYYSIRDVWMGYFNSNPQLKADTNEDGEYQEFMRWSKFWQNRVDNSDPALSGKLFNLSNAFTAYKQSSLSLPPNINPNPWSYCGPVDHEKQHNALISAIWVDTISNKHQQIIYAGTDASGIWKTTNGGLNWTNVTDASGLYLIGVNNIKGDPRHANIIYAATGGGGICSGTPFGVGIICSTDAGATWNVIYSEQLSLSYYILVDPNPPTGIDRIYVGYGGKVIRMENNGSGWTATPIYNDSSTPLRYIRDIEFKPGNSDVLYVSTDDASYPHYRNRAFVFKLTGVSFGSSPAVQFFHPFCDSLYSQRYEIAVNGLTPNSVYVIGQTFPGNTGSSAFVEIWKSINSGLTWNMVSSQQESVGNIGGENVMGGGNLSYSKIELQISPKDTNIMYVGGNSISRIYYNNVNWVEDCHTGYYFDGSFGYHPDTREAIIINGGLPGSHGANDTLICGNDGGVSMTTNGITNWKSLNGNGLWANEFWGIGSSEKNPYWMGGGTTHTGFFQNSNGSWETTEEGDKGPSIVDFEQPNRVYMLGGINMVETSTAYGRIFPFWFFPSDSNLYTSFYRPVILNPKTSSIMIASDHDLWRNDHMHDNPFGFYPNGFYIKPVTISSGTIKYSELINCIAIAPSDTSTILLSYDGKHENDPNRKHKLLKSSNSGASFTDLLTGNASLLTELTNRGITSLAISPTDKDKMWVTLGGFSGTAGQRKVYYSSDGGQSFSDISTGLPDFPVNRIRCRKGTDDQVFIGTDVGVFYKDNTHSTWQPFNGGLPVSMVTDIELLEEKEILRVSTYGRGVWQTYLYPCPNVNNNPLLITRDTTWGTPIIMDRSIQVKAPATLTIRTRVRFPVMTKIMIEPGATLVCDAGCDLTNSCNGMWLGIELWGNSTLRQTPANQGVAYFSNGAIVENARIGITTCKKDDNGYIIWITTGGIIHANYAVFRNNFKAVEFLTYPFAQQSIFNNMTFETTGPFSDLASQPQTFVSLLSINGLRFNACNFINKSAYPYSLPSIDNGIGITSINAGFMVNGLCISTVYPCTQWMPGNFEGLWYGIKAMNTDPVAVVSVDRCTFKNNLRACYFSGVANPAVTSTEFLLPKNVNYPHDFLDGLYLDECTGSFNVQENHFHIHGVTDLNSIGSYYGLIVNNSGPDSRMIYNNKFDTLGFGIIAELINRNTDGTTGLCLKCNQFNKTLFDQAITGDDTYYPGLGIAKAQGTYDPQNPDVKSPAGNTFSSNHNQGVADIYNGGGSIIYTHHTSSNPYNLRVRPDFHSPSVSLHAAYNLTYQKDIACPSLLNSGGGLPDQLKSLLSGEDSQVSSLNSQLSSLIDGGNTDATNADVFFSIPPEAMQLHDDLIGKSPYLSDTVMKSSINKEDVLPNAMIRDILVANPQSAKSNDVMNELDNRFVPMPDTMMSEILAGKDIVGLKEQLEGKLFEHQLWQNYYLGELIRYYSQDTSGINAADSIIPLLENRSDLHSKYILAFEYLSNGQTDLVNEVLNSIPGQFQLTDWQIKEYHDYSDYLQILRDLQSQNLTIYDVNADQINQLQQLAAGGSDPVQAYSRSILIANNLISYTEPIYLPNETKSAIAGKEPKPHTALNAGSLILFPNPANQYMIANYDYSGEVSSNKLLVLSVVTSEGKIVIQKELKKFQDQLLIDCRNLSAGTYLCRISNGKKTLGSSKFVIVK